MIPIMVLVLFLQTRFVHVATKSEECTIILSVHVAVDSMLAHKTGFAREHPDLGHAANKNNAGEAGHHLVIVFFESGQMPGPFTNN